MPTPTVHELRKSFVASLWLGALGSPIIWAIHLQLLYSLVMVANHTHSAIWLYMTTGVCTVLALACGAVSWRDWRRVQGEQGTLDSGGPAGRTRFLSVIGMYGSVFFALTILATGAAAYFLKASWV